MRWGGRGGWVKLPCEECEVAADSEAVEGRPRLHTAARLVHIPLARLGRELGGNGVSGRGQRGGSRFGAPA